MRNRLLFFALVIALLPSVAAAQNREHLQMNADLRILQEQVNKLQLTANQLAEQLKATGKRLDEVADANVKGFANQQLLINQITANLRTMSEKLDDNNVRVSQLTQEFSAIREGVRMLTNQINVLVSLLQPPVNPTADAGAGAAPATSTGALQPVPQPTSPLRYYQQAESDYMSARYDNAIEGFRELIEKFPSSPDAARAQLYIGDSYYQQKNCKAAVQEYQKVISTYQDSALLPDAYLMQGICYQDLNQAGQARKMLELVRDKYPNTPQAVQAVQKLRGMGVTR